MNNRMSPRRFVLYMCGLIVAIFAMAVVIFVMTRPLLHEWASVPTLMFVIISAAISGVLLGNAARSGRE